jgi:dTDP-glucose pyrophosphorylase
MCPQVNPSHNNIDVETNALQAVILVGGLGTRLGSMTKDTPKPLLTIAGRPFLEYLLLKLDLLGFDKVVLLAGHHSHVVDNYVAQIDTGRLEVSCVKEPQPAGTAGALICAQHLLEDSFLMMNGDSLFDFNWLDLITKNESIYAPLGTIALREMTDAGRYGSISLSGTRISDFSEKNQSSGPALINGGVYWLRREIINYIQNTPCSLEIDLFPILAQSGLLHGKLYDGFFLDIGVPADFTAAETTIPLQFKRQAVFIDLSLFSNGSQGDDATRILLSKENRDLIQTLNQSGAYVVGFTNVIYSENPTTNYDNESLRNFLNIQLRRNLAHLDHITDLGNVLNSETVNVSFGKIDIEKSRSIILAKETTTIPVSLSSDRPVIYVNNNQVAKVAEDILLKLDEIG